MKKRIAFVNYLYPTEGGVKNRITEQLALLSKEFDVYFFYLVKEKQEVKNGEGKQIRDYTKKIIRLKCDYDHLVSRNEILSALRTTDFHHGILFCARGFLKGIMYGMSFFYAPYISDKAIKQVQDAIDEENIEVYWGYGIPGGVIGKSISCRYKFLDLCDSIALLYDSLKGGERNFVLRTFMDIDQQLCERFEKSIAPHFDRIAFSNHRDGDRVGLARDSYRVLPNIRQVKPVKKMTKVYDIIMGGKWAYLPNEHSLVYALEKIFPLLKNRARIAITGLDMRKELLGRVTDAAEKNTDVEIQNLGAVSKYMECVSGSKMFLIPIKSGAGVSNKIMDGLEAGIPVLTSPFLKHGMDSRNECHGIIACNSEKEYAEWITKLVKNGKVRGSLGGESRKFYKKISDDSIEAFNGTVDEILLSLKNSHSQ